jgi:hypothetical protein
MNLKKYLMTNKKLKWSVNRPFLILIASIYLIGCKKDVADHSSGSDQHEIHSTQATTGMTNPLSVRNVAKAREALFKKGHYYSKTTDVDSQFIYFKFDPQSISEQTFSLMENDTTVKLLDFPFASAS